MNWRFAKWLLATLLAGGFACTVVIVNRGCNDYSRHSTGSEASPTPASSSNPSPTPTPASQPSDPEPPGEWDTVEATGTDGEGRTAEFLVAVLSQEERWALREVDMLETGAVEEVFPRYLEKLPELAKAKEIVVVGTASQEGGLQNEENRADRRADNLLRIVRPVAGVRPLYKLNLGQHARLGRSDDTSYQRRVILIGIMDRDPAMDFEDVKLSLYNALHEKGKYSFDTLQYSDFAFSEV